MDLELTDDQKDLYTTAGQVIESRAPLSLARDLLEGGGDASSLWGELRGLGWYSVGLDADDPFGTAGLCLLAERCGAQAAPTLLVDTAVCARIATAGLDHGPVDGALGELAGGSLTATLAVLETGADWTLSGTSAEAVRSSDGSYRLQARKLGVHHARFADLLAVVADLEGELMMMFVPPAASGCAIVDERGLDPVARGCRVELVDVIVPSTMALPIAHTYVPAFAVGAVATAAEGIGAAGSALQMAVSYSLERQQFGKPIGSFQALAHLMADLHIMRESAWATILFAATALEEGLPEADEAASIAKAHVARAMRDVVEGALQVLGGIAFTWEHDVHLLQRRVLDCERRFGDALQHEQRLSELLLAAHHDAEGAVLPEPVA